jgi:hypothetical protein
VRAVRQPGVRQDLDLQVRERRLRLARHPVSRRRGRVEVLVGDLERRLDGLALLRVEAPGDDVADREHGAHVLRDRPDPGAGGGGVDGEGSEHGVPASEADLARPRRPREIHAHVPEVGDANLAARVDLRDRRRVVVAPQHRRRLEGLHVQLRALAEQLEELAILDVSHDETRGHLGLRSRSDRDGRNVLLEPAEPHDHLVDARRCRALVWRRPHRLAVDPHVAIGNARDGQRAGANRRRGGGPRGDARRVSADEGAAGAHGPHGEHTSRRQQHPAAASRILRALPTRELESTGSPCASPREEGAIVSERVVPAPPFPGRPARGPTARLPSSPAARIRRNGPHGVARDLRVRHPERTEGRGAGR